MPIRCGFIVNVICLLWFYKLEALSNIDISSTTHGTAFVISMMRNVWDSDSTNFTYMRVFVTNPSIRKVLITVEVESIVSNSFTIEAKKTKQIRLSSKVRHDDVGIHNAIHIASNENISVLVIANGQFKDGFVAIPIEAFGTSYTVVTLPGQPVFNVLSTADDTEVIIKFNKWSVHEDDGKDKYGLVINRKTIYPGSVRTVYIKRRYQYFQFHDCGPKRHNRTDFTGTIISSLSLIGIISGNCLTSSMGEYNFHTHVEEMLFPNSSLGRHYYFQTPDSGVESRIRIIGKPEFLIRLVINGSRENFRLPENETYIDRFVDTGAQVLVVSKSAMSVILFVTKLVGDSVVEQSMVHIIPNENWLSWYYVSIPLMKKTNLTAQLTVVILTKDLPGLNIDLRVSMPAKKQLQEAEEDEKVTIMEFVPGFTSLTENLEDKESDNVHVVYHMDGRKFGCYVALTWLSGYLYFPAGAMYRNVYNFHRQCKNPQKYLYGEDGIDNDCDGLVDEEILNNKDDDYDSKVDEDLGIVSGAWSQWSEETICSTKCRSDQGVVGYYRMCTNPEPSKHGYICEGTDFKQKEGLEESCRTTDLKCPEECPNGTWFYGCKKMCSAGCLDTCDKSTGLCKACKPGYPLSFDYRCNQDFFALEGNVSHVNVTTTHKPPAQDHKDLAHGSQEVEIVLGWKIYATVVYIGAIIIIGIVYEVYKRYRNNRPAKGRRSHKMARE